MAQSTVSTALPASPQVIGNAFIHQYYKILHESPDSVQKFYQDSSILNRPNSEGAMTSVTTMKAINDLIMSLNFSVCYTEIETVDSQTSHKDGVLIIVTGSFTGTDNIRRKFSQSFFLAPQEHGGYFVLNDVFRFLNETQVREVNLLAVECFNDDGPKASLTPDIEPALLEYHVNEDHLSEAEVENNNESLDSSENINAAVNDEAVIDSPVQAVQNGVQPLSEVTASVSQDDAPKKSYASILKVIKGSSSPSPINVTPSKVKAAPLSTEKPATASAAPVSAAVSTNPVGASTSTKPASSSESSAPSSNSIAENNSREEESHSIYIKNLPIRTADISISALDGDPVRLPTAAIHEFVFQALDDTGRPRGLGGDYFETDLSGQSWKSRPPVVDGGHGSYSFKLQVHSDFPGEYNFTIVLLFRSFEGLKFSPQRFKFRKEIRRIKITFYSSNVPSPPSLSICRSADFSEQLLWSGRWTRHGKKEECEVDDDGRYRCLHSSFPCEQPWCEGPLGALESNGWVYSAHCSFKIFNQDEAWKCLKNKWLFFWGDSNHVDTIRNLLNFVLGRPEIDSVPRRFDRVYSNPKNGSETVRITSIFNGHWNETMNYLGLHSLQNEEFRQKLWKYFREDTVPDAMIINSGLHDGVYWRSIRAFAAGAEYAAAFWEDVFRDMRRSKGAMPKVFYRTTIATGGYARDLAFNPSKMEAFNSVLMEKMMERGLLTGGVIDEFDMTFPWHYDNRCNDGVHYGRAPAKRRWTDGEVGHQYFVDLMLGHVLLNAICNE